MACFRAMAVTHRNMGEYQPKSIYPWHRLLEVKMLKLSVTVNDPCIFITGIISWLQFAFTVQPLRLFYGTFVTQNAQHPLLKGKVISAVVAQLKQRARNAQPSFGGVAVTKWFHTISAAWNVAASPNRSRMDAGKLCCVLWQEKAETWISVPMYRCLMKQWLWDRRGAREAHRQEGAAWIYTIHHSPLHSD